RQFPVEAQATAGFRRPRQDVGGRQPADVTERGGRGIRFMSKEEKVGDGEVIERVRYRRVKTDGFDGAAENEPGADMGVIEWPDAKKIARTEQAASARAPDGEGEIAREMVHALLAPLCEGSQDQFGVGR